MNGHAVLIIVNSWCTIRVTDSTATTGCFVMIVDDRRAMSTRGATTVLDNLDARTSFTEFVPSYARPHRIRYCHTRWFGRALDTAIPARGDRRWRPVLYRQSDGWRLSKETHHVVAGL